MSDVLTTLFQEATSIITEAQKTTLGITALLVMAASIVIILLFRNSSNLVKTFAFLLFLLAMIIVIFKEPIENYMAKGDQRLTNNDTPDTQNLVNALNSNCVTKNRYSDWWVYAFKSLESLENGFKIVTENSEQRTVNLYIDQEQTIIDRQSTDSISFSCKVGNCISDGNGSRLDEIKLAFDSRSCTISAESIFN